MTGPRVTTRPPGANLAASTFAASTFAEPQDRAAREAFDRLMARKGGEPPRPGDELPTE